jgi:hypothetical protein
MNIFDIVIEKMELYYLWKYEICNCHKSAKKDEPKELFQGLLT